MFLVLTQAFGSFGIFAGRAFLPALVAALLVRFGADQAWLRHLGIDHNTLPPWFTHNVTIGVLAVLTALEFAANRNADARRALAEVDHWAKPAMAALVAFGLVSARDSAFAGQLFTAAPVQQAGVGAMLPVLVSAVFTYWGAGLRNGLVRQMHDLDPDDDFGVQRVFVWAEDLWAGFGIVLLLLFPLLMAGLVALVVGGIYLLKRRAEKREDADRVACGGCGGAIYRSALQCHACAVVNPAVFGLTWLGTTGQRPAGDLTTHPFALTAKKRCPRCAARLGGRSPGQACTACGHQPFGEADFVRQYDRHIAARLPVVLIASLVLSAVPVVGLLPGIILYRMRLVSPFRAYVPRGASLLTRWGLRVSFFVLVLLHLVPAAGAVTVPLLATLNWAAYRRAFLRRVPALLNVGTAKGTRPADVSLPA